MEDAALAVVYRPDHWLMLACPALGLVGERGGQQVDVLDRSTHALVQLVLGMQPLGRHVLGDGMLAIADRDQESMLWAVAGAGALALRDEHRLAVLVERQPPAEAVVAPAHADHFV